MGSEAFEATVPTREEVRRKEAESLYRGLTKAGMASFQALGVIESLYLDQAPKLTASIVEHTGVFGLWDERNSPGEWRAMDTGIQHGPRCVMEAELRQLLNVHERKWLTVREFAQDGTPIIEGDE